MKSYDKFIKEVAPIWREMIKEDGPPEVVEKFTEEELQALSDYIAKATFKMHVGAMRRGYEMAEMDDLLERGMEDHPISSLRH